MIGDNCNAERFCCEDISLIENYYDATLDKENFWVCHHRLELIETGGICDCDAQDLKDWGIYFDRPADELIFLKISDHNNLHMTAERRLKISGSMKGGNSTSFKPGHIMNDETKNKISKTLHNKRKIMVEFSNGQIRSTKEIAQILGWSSSSKVGQYIRKFGYIPCNGIKLHCHIVEN